MVIVKAINLHEKGIFSRHEVTFHNLWNLLEMCNHDIVLVGFREGYAYESTDVQTECLWLDKQS